MGLAGLIGIDVGGLVSGGLDAFTQITLSNNALRISQQNALIARQDASAEIQSQKSVEAQTRLLVTGGLVIAAAVIAVRALRK